VNKHSYDSNLLKNAMEAIHVEVKVADESTSAKRSINKTTDEEGVRMKQGRHKKKNCNEK
jgi:hypothetical protein